MKWRYHGDTPVLRDLTVLSMPVGWGHAEVPDLFCIMLRLLLSHCCISLYWETFPSTALTIADTKTEMEFPTPCLMIHCAAFVLVASSGVRNQPLSKEGCYGRTIPVPDDFEFGLFEDDWERWPLHESGMHRVPRLEHVSVRDMINGPESLRRTTSTSSAQLQNCATSL